MCVGINEDIPTSYKQPFNLIPGHGSQPNHFVDAFHLDETVSLQQCRFNEQSTQAANARLQRSLGNGLVKLPGNLDPIRDDELEALIWDCLDLLLPTLPPEQAYIVRAVDMEQASPQSVAEIYGLSLSDVNTHLARGRQGLKDRFGEMLMICPEHGLAGCACHLKGDAET